VTSGTAANTNSKKFMTKTTKNGKTHIKKSKIPKFLNYSGGTVKGRIGEGILKCPK
jgi:hypothetical protein